MNPDATEQIRDAFALESSVPIPLLSLGCGVVALALGALLLLEQRRATRPSLVPLLFAFRALALAGVWLALANPTAIRTTRSTLPRHTAIVLDTSASMRLDDRSNSNGNAARWNRATSESAAGTAPLDDALALLGAAAANLAQAAQLLDPAEIRPLVASADSAIRAALGPLGAPRDPQIDPLLAQLETEVLALLQARNRAALPALAARLTEIRERVRPLADAAAIALGPGARPLPRINLACQWLDGAERGWLRTLARDTALTRAQFANAPAPIEANWLAVQATDPAEVTAATDLQAALNNLARRAADGRLDLAMIVTDGVHNAAGAPLALPEPLASVPLLVVPIGDQEPRRDLDLRWHDSPKTLLVGDEFAVQARVSASLCDGEKSAIDLVLPGKVLDSAPLEFAGNNADRFAELKWKPERAGIYNLSLRVRPIEREASLTNNEAAFKLHVIDQKIELLIADAEPRWETRYLFNLFRRDPQAKLAAVLFEPVHAYPGRALATPPTLPMTIEGWQEFHAVVLGDLTPVQLTEKHQQLLRQYVENGGALVVIAGKNAMPAAFTKTPLAEMLPVLDGGEPSAPAGFGVRFTDEARLSDALRISGDSADANAALWKAIFDTLPVYDLSRWSQPKPSARVLLDAVPRAGNAKPRAFLATQPFGRGSVTFVASPSTWFLRWRFGDRYHYQFWGQFLRALVANNLGAGSQFARLQTDKRSYELGESVQARLRLRTANGEPLTGIASRIVAAQGGKAIVRAVAAADPNVPGEYTATLSGLPAGNFDVQVESEELAARASIAKLELPRTPVIIQPATPSREMMPPSVPPPFFSMIKSSPRGLLLAPASVPSALEHFCFTPRVTETTTRRPLWNRWDLLLAIVGCLGVEWIGRKLAGLI
jgi:hypothetical protein